MSELIVTEQGNPYNPNARSFDERVLELEAIERHEAEMRRREKNSPFSRWTQFNNEHTKELMQLAIKYPRAHAILYFLVDQMDNYNAVLCSSRVIEEVLGVSRQTVSKNIKILRELGFLAVLKSGNANVYAVNDKVYWKSWGNNRKYSKFPANVVLAMSEQDTEYQEANIEVDKLRSVTIKDIEV